MSFLSWKLLISYYLVCGCLVLNIFVTSSQPGCQSVLCNRYKTCSQKCEMVGIQPQRSCVDGFELQNDNTTCIANDPNWTLFFTTENIIFSLTGSGDYFPKLIEPKAIMTNLASNMRFITCDVRFNTIYWTDVSNQQKGVYKMSLSDFEKSSFVDSGFYSPNGIAFDWITGNVYIIDSKKGFIAVCGTNTTKCATVVQEPIGSGSNLIDIALHPNEGLMFWTNRGKHKSIKKAGMDGSNISTIASENLGWPNGITVDEANSRIYWIEALDEYIETTRFDGSDRQKFDVSEHPFAIDIFGDMIFWSDLEDEEILSVNKFRGRTTRIYSESMEPYGLTVMHITKQPELRANPCNNSLCTHICALSENSFQCLCPAGMLKNGNACLDDDKITKLLVVQQNVLLMTRIGTIGREIFEQVHLPPQIQMIKALVYNPANNSVILSEDTLNVIVEYKMETQEYTVLVNNDMVNVTLMDIDVVSENLIWFDAGKQTVEAMSLKTGTRIVLLKDLENLFDIMFIPIQGALYFSKAGGVDNYAQIFKLYLYTNSTEELIETISIHGTPVHLVFDKTRNTIDAVYMNKTDITIRSIFHFGRSVNWKSPLNALMDVVQINSEIYLLDKTDTVSIISTPRLDARSPGLLKTNFNSSSGPTQLSYNKIFAVVDRNIDSLQEMRSSHPCSPGNPNRKPCSHICLPGPNRTSGECQCPANLRLSNDGLNCISEDSQSETTSPDNYIDESYVEANSTESLSSTTISMVQKSMNNSDSSKESNSKNTNAVTGFLIVSTLVIVILIVAGILGIIAFLVISQRKDNRVCVIPKRYVRSST